MRFGWCFIAAVAIAGCGARTDLTVTTCGDGGTRPCSNECGIGTQICAGGVWSACEVPLAERTCEAGCGAGTQICEAGLWRECEGPVTAERGCTNTCGEGIERCDRGVWAACEVAEIERPCSTRCGDGFQVCRAGGWGPCTAPEPRPPSLEVVVRDFSDAHPDFEEGVFGDDHDIVEAMLGADAKPIYRGGSPTTSNGEAFDQWYRDTPGVNERTSIELPLASSPSDPALFVFEDPSFFPIDGALLGNEGREHNFHFTIEATGSFIYRGGETFRFRGDDDVFIFIDRRLAIDLGGVHSAQDATVSLDDFDLTVGERYELHIFFAERHTEQSSFLIETSVSDPILCE